MLKSSAATLAALALLESANGCTIFILGKKATAAGVNIVTHTDDAGGEASDMRLVRVPAADHPPGKMRPIYNWRNGYPRIVSKDRGPEYMPLPGQNLTTPIGYIEEVAHTYGIWENDYGLMNDQHLAMGESTLSSKLVGFPRGNGLGGKCLWEIAELSRIALERCKTARCAIQLMGDLAFRDGFFSEDSGTPDNPDYDDSAEGLGICDLDECWTFNIMTGMNNEGAVWAAQRLPEDQVTAIPNTINIRHIDFEDAEGAQVNFMCSNNTRSVAKAMGFWDGKSEFDFFAAYGFDYDDYYDEVVDDLYDSRRMWRFYDLLAPSLKLDGSIGYAPLVPTYNHSYRPDEPVELEKVFAIQRDYFAGTPWDMSKGLAAGPFGSPIRFDTSDYGLKGSWERPISIFRGVFSHVAVLDDKRPDPLKSTLWYGQANTLATIYTPVFGAQDKMPVSYVTGINSKFNRDSAWWAFDFLANWIQIKYSYMSKEMSVAQSEWEGKGAALLDTLESKINDLGPNNTALALKIAEEASVSHATDLVSFAWSFGEYLIGKYSDGYITTGEGPGEQADPGYSKEWLEQLPQYLNFPNGPPPAEVRNHSYPPTASPAVPVMESKLQQMQMRIEAQDAEIAKLKAALKRRGPKVL